MENEVNNEQNQPLDSEEKFLEFINTCKEYELYFIIDEAGAFLFRMNHMLENGQIPDEDINKLMGDMGNISHMQGLAAAKSARFGVNFELTEEHNEELGRSIKKPTQEYWSWLHHWDNWKKNFNDETWTTFMTTFQDLENPNREEVIESFLPEKPWNE